MSTNLQDKAKWTVMIYFAADNNLDAEAFADLEAIKKVGSTNNVNIVAQLDSQMKGVTYRYLLKNGTTLQQDIIGNPLPEVNTGDPRVLTDFISWAMDNFEAENTMLVLWGHGYGWESIDHTNRIAALSTDFVIYKDIASNEELDGCSIAFTRSGKLRKFARGYDGIENLEKAISNVLPGNQYRSYQNQTSSFDILEHGTNNGAGAIGFLPDYNPGDVAGISQDILTMVEFKSALKNALKPNQKISVLGMDACLMGMIEVGYQIKEHVDFLVASEDATPNDGWPYEKIFRKLVDHSYMTPEQLSITIVREYLIYYRELGKDATSSVCKLDRLNSLKDSFNKLTTELTSNMLTDNCDTRIAILAARALAQGYYIKDYIDIYDFCSHLLQFSQNEKIKILCREVMNKIRFTEEPSNSPNVDQSIKSSNNLILEYGYIGYRVVGSKGISVYFPITVPSKNYNLSLLFVKDTKWLAFLAILTKSFRTSPPPNKTKVSIRPINRDYSKITSDGRKLSSAKSNKSFDFIEHRIPDDPV